MRDNPLSRFLALFYSVVCCKPFFWEQSSLRHSRTGQTIPMIRGESAPLLPLSWRWLCESQPYPDGKGIEYTYRQPSNNLGRLQSLAYAHIRPGMGIFASISFKWDLIIPTQSTSPIEWSDLFLNGCICALCQTFYIRRCWKVCNHIHSRPLTSKTFFFR